MIFTFAKEDKHKIIIISVGDGGGNAINHMIASDLKGVSFISANTNRYALKKSLATTKIQLGKLLAKGHGAGADPRIGEESAKESIKEIKSVLKGADIVFITAGLGGGTGTGAAPIIAHVCQEIGALTVALVTKPFYFEGGTRAVNASKGWTELKKNVDAIITIPNDRLVSLTNQQTKFTEAMAMVDEILLKAIRSITDLISSTGYINLDLADICTTLSGIGVVFMGTEESSEENRGGDAIRQALGCPFLQEVELNCSKKILVNITVNEENFKLTEFYEISDMIHQKVHKDAHMIIGVVFDNSIGNSLRVTILADGHFLAKGV